MPEWAGMAIVNMYTPMGAAGAATVKRSDDGNI